MVVTGTRGDVGRHGIDVALDVGAQLQPDGLGRREVLFDGGRAYVTWDMGLGGAWCLMMMMFGVAGRMKERSNDWAGGGPDGGGVSQSVVRVFAGLVGLVLWAS